MSSAIAGETDSATRSGTGGVVCTAGMRPVPEPVGHADERRPPGRGPLPPDRAHRLLPVEGLVRRSDVPLHAALGRGPEAAQGRVERAGGDALLEHGAGRPAHALLDRAADRAEGEQRGGRGQDAGELLGLRGEPRPDRAVAVPGGQHLVGPRVAAERGVAVQAGGGEDVAERPGQLVVLGGGGGPVQRQVVPEQPLHVELLEQLQRTPVAGGPEQPGQHRRDELHGLRVEPLECLVQVAHVLILVGAAHYREHITSRGAG